MAARCVIAGSQSGGKTGQREQERRGRRTGEPGTARAPGGRAAEQEDWASD